MVSKHRSLSRGAELTAKNTCWEHGWGVTGGERDWRGASLAAGSSLTHSSLSFPRHSKTSITPVQVLVGCDLRAAPARPVEAQGGWGVG